MARYARILPLRRMPRKLGVFDYRVPEHAPVAAGDIVRAPFRGKDVPAVVIALMDTADVPESRIREITERVEAPRIPEAAVREILHIADASLTSPATAAAMLLPAVPKRPPRYVPPDPDGARKTEAKKTVMMHVTDDERAERVLEAYRDAKAAGGPLLAVAPRVSAAERLRAALESEGAECAFITGTGAMGGRWSAWTSAAAADAVIGTPLALFTPVRPAVVLVDEEEAPEYAKSDAAPRFDARGSAERLAGSHGCPLILLSRSPRVETWHRLGQGLSLEPPKTEPNVRTILCDLGEESRSGRYLPVAESFLSRMDETLSAGRTCIVIINRKGVAARLLCRDCRTAVACPHCGENTAVRAKDLFCPHCRISSAIPAHCTACGGTRLMPSGAGLETVRDIFAARWPGRAVTVVTRDSPDSAREGADIILATEYLLTHYGPEIEHDASIGFVGTLSADLFLLHSYDLRSTEREFQRLRRLALTAAARGLPLHVQTMTPEFPLYAMLAKDPDAWYRQELQDRKAAGFPPYTEDMRLIASEKAHATLKEEAARIAGTLRDRSPELRIIEVRVSRTGGRTKAWITMHFPPEMRRALMAALTEILPENWGVDPAPREPIL